MTTTTQIALKEVLPALKRLRDSEIPNNIAKSLTDEELSRIAAGFALLSSRLKLTEDTFGLTPLNVDKMVKALNAANADPRVEDAIDILSGRFSRSYPQNFVPMFINILVSLGLQQKDPLSQLNGLNVELPKVNSEQFKKAVKSAQQALRELLFDKRYKHDVSERLRRDPEFARVREALFITMKRSAEALLREAKKERLPVAEKKIGDVLSRVKSLSGK